MVDNSSKLKTEIERLKREKNAVILAHYYTLPEVQEVADFLGDSLALSIEAQKTDARIILFAGVHFMAETAKVLSPERRCCFRISKRDVRWQNRAMRPLSRLSRRNIPATRWFVRQYFGRGESLDGCVLHLVQCPEGRRVDSGRPADHLRSRPEPGFLYPKADRTREYGDLGRRLPCARGVFVGKILELKRQHPAAQVVVHPECRAYIVQVADFVGSTAAILDYCGKSSAREFIVVTEAGILTEMKRRYPEKTFIPAPPDDEACGCNNCRYMKMITLENIFTTLRDERPEISLDEEVRRRAERSILNMIAIK